MVYHPKPALPVGKKAEGGDEETVPFSGSVEEEGASSKPANTETPEKATSTTPNSRRRESEEVPTSVTLPAEDD